MSEQSQVSAPSGDFAALIRQSQESHEANAESVGGGQSWLPPDGGYDWLFLSMKERVIDKDRTKNKDKDHWAIDCRFQILDGEHAGREHDGPNMSSFAPFLIDNVLRVASVLKGETVLELDEGIAILKAEVGEAVIRGVVKTRIDKKTKKTYRNVYVNRKVT